MTDSASDGYLVWLKTMNVEALKATFANDYPVAQWRDIHISIEYPVDAMNYPGVWIDYSDMDKLRIAGVDHAEYTQPDEDELIQKFTRWKFSGYVSYTVTALTSRERDALYDELVKIFAFGRYDPVRSRFREYIENNDFIAANMDFDEIEPQGNSAAPGTPWGTDEIIYERTINMEIIGEFISDNSTSSLYRLSAVNIEAIMELPDQHGELPAPGDGPTDWH